MARRIATIVCVLMLAFLFTYPRTRLEKCCNQVEALAEEAVELIIEKDWQEAQQHFHKMREAYLQDRAFMHLMLSHTYIAQLEASMLSCIELIKVEEQAQTLVELEFIITHVRFLRSIEEFKLTTLL
ncbi:DUF4363 family protein [Eubacteriales bacterium OttesenSCG-928-K08]|nr:DUF4363 family protein [Eubacteriales bacterium OttesenSCG-928-K08]